MAAKSKKKITPGPIDPTIKKGKKIHKLLIIFLLLLALFVGATLILINLVMHVNKASESVKNQTLTEKLLNYNRQYRYGASWQKKNIKNNMVDTAVERNQWLEDYINNDDPVFFEYLLTQEQYLQFPEAVKMYLEKHIQSQGHIKSETSAGAEVNDSYSGYYFYPNDSQPTGEINKINLFGSAIKSTNPEIEYKIEGVLFNNIIYPQKISAIQQASPENSNIED
ncbi:MAG: hypothetical protein WCV50_03930 [Patescibacteria group bacterium]|jgi:hypothetical protein